MDLIRDFIEATRHTAAPVLFRKWAAIGMIAAAASRQVYTSVWQGKNLRANMFIMLVAEPGMGKTDAIGSVKHVFQDFSEMKKLGATTTTIEAAVQKMGWHFKREYMDEPRSWLMANDELGTLFKEWKPFIFQSLAKMWDTEELTYEYDIKTGPDDIMYGHYPNLLVGAQPAWLAGNLPDNAFELGLPSRFMFIYNDRKVGFDERGEYDETLLEKVRQNLSLVSLAQGYFPLTSDARAAFQAWERADMPPFPNDYSLKHYAQRRNMHAGKLALIVALSRHPNNRIITLDDLNMAWEILFEAEQRMPEALSFAGSNQYRGAETYVVDYVRREATRTGQPVPERTVRGQLGRYIQSNHVSACLEEMILSGRLLQVGVRLEDKSDVGRRRFKAGSA